MSVGAAVKQGQTHPPRIGGLGATLRIAPGVWGLIIGIAVWEVLGHAWAQPFFPPFSAVLVRLGEMTADGKILANLANSLVNLVIGFGLSATIGIGLGMLMGAYRKVEMALDFYVYALLTAPSLVFAPLFFSMFGARNSRLSVIAIVIMYSLFIIIVNTTAAIRSVDRALVEMGRSYCATERQLFFKVILPAATPLIMAGLRLGVGRAVKGMINGEMFIAIIGLGAVVTSAGNAFDAEGVLAVLLVIIIVAMVAVKAVQLVDVRLTSWLPSTARQRKRA